MDAFTSIEPHLRVLLALLGDVSGPDAASAMTRLRADEVASVIERTSRVIREMETLRTVAVGVAGRLSSRDAGHGGLAQTRGHRSTITMVQQITGSTRSQAGKLARLGQAVLEAAESPAGAGAPMDAGGETSGAEDDGAPAGSAGPEGPEPDAVEPVRRPWWAPLGEAFTAGRITVDQQDAIRRGLGEPPKRDVDEVAQQDAAERAEWPRDAHAAWEAAAVDLIDEADRRTVEDLGAAARAVRDVLDPTGARARYEERYEQRSFRSWMDARGITHARIDCDDEGAAWLDEILDTALRPRRGGPRFVDPDEKAAAEALVADPRSNEQLAYDLFLDVITAGARADAASVFGTRQAGVRVIVTASARDAEAAGSTAVALIEETGVTVPATFAAQRACDTGTRECVVDTDGDPLNLGREARLFSAKQKLALGIRDGGCVWTDCDRPASYCEAHHIDKHSEGGRTDVDRGVLLCRFHHMNLHHHGWRISRQDKGRLMLHPPDEGAPIVLGRPLERRYLWGDRQAPPGSPRRFRSPPGHVRPAA